MSFSDELTPEQIQNVLDALNLPWRDNLRRDGVWCDIYQPEATGMQSDLSVNIQTGGWQDQYCNGHPDPEWDDGMRSRGDLVQLVAMINWECANDEYQIKAIKWIKNILNMDNQPSKMDVHSFHSDDAKAYGVDCAVLLFNIRFWLKKNKANGQNIHGGRVWTYNSIKAFAEIFPYFSEAQIRYRLDSLEDEGALIAGNYNEHKYDRTKWYSVNEPEFIVNPEPKSDVHV